MATSGKPSQGPATQATCDFAASMTGQTLPDAALAGFCGWFAEDFFRQGGHRFEAEDRFDREPEELGDGQRQFEAGVVVAAFDVADRLVVDAELVGELLARQPALGPENGQPVMDLALVVRHRRAGRSRSRQASARAVPGGTRSPTSRRARRCWRRIAGCCHW